MLFKKKPAKTKVSEMLINFAGDYIEMGENIEEKQQYLNGAATAWNIACLERRERKKAIERYLNTLKKYNPNYSKKDERNMKENLRLLIKKKEKLYPDEQVRIVDARITSNRKSKMRITTRWIKME